MIEWRNVHFFSDTTRRIDVNVVLHENGQILTQSRNLADDGRERGNSATLGIENATGTVALRYSFNQAVLDSEPAVTSIRYRPPRPSPDRRPRPGRGGNRRSTRRWRSSGRRSGHDDDGRGRQLLVRRRCPRARTAPRPPPGGAAAPAVGEVSCAMTLDFTLATK